MNNTIKNILILLVVVLVIWGGFKFFGDKEPQSTEPIKIGAILPLTGPGAIWGESIQNGMNLALDKINSEDKISIEIIYEDSQFNPEKGVGAYNKLSKLDNVDVIVSAASRVSAAIVPLADADEIPVISTLAVSKGLPELSKYSFRYSPNYIQYAEAHIPYIKDNFNILAILSLNDEYGVSVVDEIKENLKESDVEIVSEEKFVPFSKDFKSELAKIKEKQPEAVIIIASPIEFPTILKQIKEINIDAQLFDVGILAAKPNVEVVGDLGEGIITFEYNYSKSDKGNVFIQDYQEKENIAPIYTSSFGYDIVNLIDKARTSSDILKGLQSIKMFGSLNGKLKVHENGEINPLFSPARIIDGH